MAITTSIATTSFSSCVSGEDYGMLIRKAQPLVNAGMGKAVRSRPMMGNVNAGKGIFAPIVVVTRNIVGKKRFNQLRGKAIALHSQVIYCHLLTSTTILSSIGSRLSNVVV